ncbi:hypothetical protein H0Z60_16525 [Ectothiorhodospiraceae bacterium WFHF3C12]|nr:hypothetical protein [Ectothiorhodospiraceae bacterium WFHF3C12]
MLQNRRGETGSIPHRSGRLHCIENQWFFATRNGRLEGPYRDQDEAEAALRRFLDRRG